MFRKIIAAVILLILVSCSTPQVQENGPGLISFKSSLQNSDEALILKDILNKQPGVFEVDIHVPIKVIMISFDRKMNTAENFKKIIISNGFEAEEIKARKGSKN